MKTKANIQQKYIPNNPNFMTLTSLKRKRKKEKKR